MKNHRYIAYIHIYLCEKHVKSITYNTEQVPPFFHFSPQSSVGFKCRLSQLSAYRYALPIAVCQCSSVCDDVVDVQQNTLEKFPPDERFAFPVPKKNEYYKQQQEFAFVRCKKRKRIQNLEKMCLYVDGIILLDIFVTFIMMVLGSKGVSNSFEKSTF